MDVNPITVFACESQPVVIEGLTRVFEHCGDVQLCGHAADVELSARELRGKNPDVFLLGQPPNVKSVLPLLERARQAGIAPYTVAWVSELSDIDAFRTLQMGARGVITRIQPVSSLLECVRTVASGAVWLKSGMGENALRSPASVRITPRERQILALVCEGLRNREIAERMSITPGTVKVHLMHIFEKTGIKDRYQLALEGRCLMEAERAPAASKSETGTGGAALR